VTTDVAGGQPTSELVWAELAEVPDPELPVVSVVDLGVVRRVEVDGATVRVELLPTFVGCPAIDLMRSAVAERLARVAERVEVSVSFAEPWTSERISATDTRLENPFGSTLCRAMHWCASCRQPFEEFKPV
jgi:ring-1,2-phenylacetyl-CoA epoxidase subunit PaaD